MRFRALNDRQGRRQPLNHDQIVIFVWGLFMFALLLTFAIRGAMGKDRLELPPIGAPVTKRHASAQLIRATLLGALLGGELPPSIILGGQKYDRVQMPLPGAATA